MKEAELTKLTSILEAKQKTVKLKTKKFQFITPLLKIHHGAIMFLLLMKPLIMRTTRTIKAGRL